MATHYTETKISISSLTWLAVIYRQVILPTQDILLDCMAICFLEIGSKCKVLAVEPPICYLGDPNVGYTATENDKNVTVFFTNGNLFPFLFVVLLSVYDNDWPYALPPPFSPNQIST